MPIQEYLQARDRSSMTAMTGTPRHILFFVLGSIAVIAGILLSPSFIAAHFKPTGIQSHSTVLEIHVLRALSIAAGAIFYGYAFLLFTNGALARQIEHRFACHIFSLGVTTALSIAVVTILVHDVERIGYPMSIDPNEGWNVFHTSSLIHGEPLYRPIAGVPFTPVNYPPLSFLIVGALSGTRGDLLATGRWVSLVSLLLVGFLIYAIVERMTSNRSAAGLSSLLWLALLVGQANDYVGMDDPQGLGHVFSVGALYLYVRWSNRLTPPRIVGLALLCCLGLFIKQLFIAVPVALATALFLENKRQFAMFVFAGIGSVIIFIAGTWLLAGNDFLSNFFLSEFEPNSMALMVHRVSHLFLSRLDLVFVFAFAVLLLLGLTSTVVLVYFPLTLLIGIYASREIGADINVWFDFFIAGAAALGLLAARLTSCTTRWTRVLVYGILALCLLPVARDMRTGLYEVLDAGSLQLRGPIYQADITLLHSIPGPALFDDPLFGFAAGKDFVFDASWTSKLIAMKVFPERALTDRIRRRYFGAIVLVHDLNDEDKFWPRWPRGVIDAIAENYRLIDPGRPRYMFFYLPRAR